MASTESTTKHISGRHPHAAIEMVQRADTLVGGAEKGAKALKIISGLQAYHRFDWVRGVPVVNQAGNFRGMVINAEWKTAFQWTSKAASVLGDVATLTGFAVNLAHAAPQIESILNSKEGWDTKGPKLCLQVSSLAFRTVAGAVPWGLVALSAEGYAETADLVTGGSYKLTEKLKSTDAKIATGYTKVTDPQTMYAFVNTYAVF
jgi:hypothetical protein